jgi:hypothetical protein
MDSIILPLFYSLFALIIIEQLLSGFWSKFYFTFGIPILTKHVSIQNFPNIDIISSKLEYLFETDKSLKKFQCKKLDETKTAFREKIFDFSILGLKYTPVMHGKISINKVTMQITIKGLLNWSTLFFLILWYLFVTIFNFPAMQDESKWLFLLLFGIAPVIMFGGIYLIQRSKYEKIIEFVSRIE